MYLERERERNVNTQTCTITHIERHISSTYKVRRKCYIHVRDVKCMHPLMCMYMHSLAQM